jgi:hypothetical protein
MTIPCFTGSQTVTSISVSGIEKPKKCDDANAMEAIELLYYKGYFEAL